MRAVDRDFEAFAQKGDLDAFTRVYEHTSSRLLAIAVKLVRDAGEAEELVQQTFVAAIESAANFRAGRSVEAWLAGILANRARRSWTNRRAANDADEPADAAPGPARSASGREALRHVEAKIDELAEPYRSVAVLHLLHGLEPAAIAHALQRPPATVRAQLMRARRRLQDSLPVGLAGAAVAVPTTPGLAAVQATVLRRASDYAASLSTISTTTALTMTTTLGKSLFLSLAGACAAAAWIFWPAAEAPPIPAASGGEDAGITAATATEPTRDAQRDAGAAPADDERARVPTPAVGHGRLRVVVRTEQDGRPLAGVAVTVGRDRSRFTPTQRATTDASGCARFERLTTGSWWLQSSSDATPQWVGIEAAKATEVVLETGPPTFVEGLVVDRRQRPVADALIRLGHSSPAMRLRPVTTSDERGAFRIPMFSLSHIEASADGHQSVCRQVSPTGGSTPVRFELPDGGAAMAGVVVDAADGRPVVDARVTILRDRSAKLPDGNSLSTFGHRTHTGADGAFAWSGLVPGPARVLVDAPDHAARLIDVELRAGDVVAPRIELDEGATLAGVVRDPDGGPLAGVTIRSRWHDDARLRTTTTGDDGRYRLGCLPAGHVELTAVTDAAATRLGARATIRLTAGEVSEWSPLVHDGFQSIDGSLRDQRGQPLADWFVVLHHSRGSAGIARQVAADGRFRFGPLAANDTYSLQACPPGPVYRGGVPKTAAARTWHEIAVGTIDLDLVVDDAQLPTSWLRGHVDRTHVPKGRRALFVTDADGARLVVSMADDCSFEAGPLRAGEWRIAFGNEPTAWLGTYRLSSREDRDVGLLAPRPTGRVRVAIDSTLPWSELRGQIRVAITDRDTGHTGRSRPIWQAPWELSLPIGDYRMRIVETPWRPDVREFSLAAGEIVDVTLRPTPAQVCAFVFHRDRAAGDDDEPRALDVTVHRLDAAGTTLGVGAFSQRLAPQLHEWSLRCNLAPGHYRIDARLATDATASHAFHVPADGTPIVRTRRLELR